jgi:hypothetical protein
MGYTPHEVDDMSMWEFHVVVEGWQKANSLDESGGKLSEAEKDEIWEWMETMPPVPLSSAVH